MRRWPHDYWQTISWGEFRAHLAFERERQKNQERDEERMRQSRPFDTPTGTSGTYGKPPPVDVLKVLPGWEGTQKVD